MLLHLVFYAILAGAVVLPFLGSLTIVHAVGKLTTKSEAPKRADTLEEATARKAKAIALHAQMKAMNDWYAVHPFPRGWSARRAYNTTAIAFAKTLNSAHQN